MKKILKKLKKKKWLEDASLTPAVLLLGRQEGRFITQKIYCRRTILSCHERGSEDVWGCLQNRWKIRTPRYVYLDRYPSSTCVLSHLIGTRDFPGSRLFLTSRTITYRKPGAIGDPIVNQPGKDDKFYFSFSVSLCFPHLFWQIEQAKHKLKRQNVS